MRHRAQHLLYLLSAFVLLNAFFVLQPARAEEVRVFQRDIRVKSVLATVQVVGDYEFFDGLDMVWRGINDFYASSAENFLALLEPRGTDDDVIYVFSQIYLSFNEAFRAERQGGVVAGERTEAVEIDFETFMSEEPLRNIIPDPEVPLSLGSFLKTEPRVAGVAVVNQGGEEYYYGEVVNRNQPWVSIKDNWNGEIYCIALYNGEVNKYSGKCKYDYQ